jgi:hypothetical protein
MGANARRSISWKCEVTPSTSRLRRSKHSSKIFETMTSPHKSEPAAQICLTHLRNFHRRRSSFRFVARGEQASSTIDLAIVRPFTNPDLDETGDPQDHLEVSVRLSRTPLTHKRRKSFHFHQETQQRTVLGYHSRCSSQHFYNQDLPQRLSEASYILITDGGYFSVGNNMPDMFLRRLLRPVDAVFGYWMKVNQLYQESSPFCGPAAAGPRRWKTLSK